MAKRVVVKPDWINSNRVTDIYSVSGCVSQTFGEYINDWKHNGYWLFDSPEIIATVADIHRIDLASATLFFYEVYEKEFDANTEQWTAFALEPSFPTHVVQPAQKHLAGYDVVTFSVHTSPECSPLSCNSYATEIATNEHCLLDSLDNALQLVETGAFNDSEPGPFRIFAVYTLE